MSKIASVKPNTIFSSEIGGKAKGLQFLCNNHFLTPTFYVLDFLSLSGILNGSTDLNDLLDQWIEVNNIKEEDLWAVRSSVDNEDGVKRSFAGFFSTEINVKTSSLYGAIKNVLRSYSKLDEDNLKNKSEFGIIIQEMIRSEYSGVVFSHDPSNIKNDTMFINIIPGIGENLVSGKNEAFSITYSGKKFSFLNAEEIFSGQIMQSELIDVVKTGEEIKKDIGKHLQELVNGTKTLFKKKKQPIDIEFTIANDTLYWLQIRPITTGNDEVFIWDNTHIEGNYPGQTLPLSISFVTYTFYKTYKGMASFLGMPVDLISSNEKLFNNMSGEINGGLYYNVTAWQKLIYQLPFGKKISKLLPQLWGMEAATFIPEKNSTSLFVRVKLVLRLIISFFLFRRIKKRYEQNFERSLMEFEKMDLSKCSYAELIAIYHKVELQFGSNWEAPLLNGFFTAIFSSALKKTVIHSRLNVAYPNFVNDILFAQGDVISVTIVKEFQKIIHEIQTTPELNNLFREYEPKQIKKTLKEKYVLFDQKIEKYIYNYGDRSGEGELKMETINYKEDPLLFVEFLKQNSKYGSVSDRNNPSFNHASALKNEYPYNFIKRLMFHWLIKQTIKRVRDRENYRFMRTVTFSVVRKIFRAIDSELLRMGYIKQKNDSLYLSLNEIINSNGCEDFWKLIEKKKSDYERYLLEQTSNRYIQSNHIFTAVVLYDDSETDRILNGTGCCSGVVKARIKIILDKNDENASHEGKILVANYFEPGKINLFSQAAGIISIRGNLLSHTAIICREMGIPSIVGAKGLLSRIKDGDLIEMNGSNGKIKLLLDHE